MRCKNDAFSMPFKDMMSGNSHKWPYQTTSSRRKVTTSRKPKGRGAWALDEAFLTACGKPVAGKPGISTRLKSTVPDLPIQKSNKCLMY